MKKGTKIALIVLSVLTFACCAGLWSVFNNTTERMEEVKAEALTAGDEIIVLLAGDWSYQAVELRTSQTLGTSEEVEQILSLWNDKLGTLTTSTGEITATRYDLDGPSGAIVYADYTAECEFEKGSATVVLELSREPGNKWLLKGFTVTPAG